MGSSNRVKVVVIVAHPDDEILWAGGTLLSNPSWDLVILSLCRANDEERASKFYKTLKLLNAKGKMSNLDDGPKQTPLSDNVVEQLLMQIVPNEHFDLIITHNPLGEYTTHLRHEEISKAVINLWKKGKISTDVLWLFAYEDGNKTYFPKPIEKADVFQILSNDLWLKKYEIISKIYGFVPESWAYWGRLQWQRDCAGRRVDGLRNSRD